MIILSLSCLLNDLAQTRVDENKLQSAKREEKPHFRKQIFDEVQLIKGYYQFDTNFEFPRYLEKL